MHCDGSVQDCSNSFANALELLQSCTKLLIECTDVLWYLGHTPLSYTGVRYELCNIYSWVNAEVKMCKTNSWSYISDKMFHCWFYVILPINDEKMSCNKIAINM